MIGGELRCFMKKMLVARKFSINITVKNQGPVKPQLKNHECTYLLKAHILNYNKHEILSRRDMVPNHVCNIVYFLWNRFLIFFLLICHFSCGQKIF